MMTNIYYGTCEDIKQVNIKKGGYMAVVTLRISDEATIDVLYFNHESRPPVADWVLNKKDKYVGNYVALTATKKTSVTDKGKARDAYFGSVLPSTYRLIELPAELKDNVSDDDLIAVSDSIDECIASGDLPSCIEVDFTDAKSVVDTMEVLKSADTDLARQTCEAMSKLLVRARSLYIGKIAGVYTSDKDDPDKSVTRVSFAKPGTTPAEWCTVSYFGQTGVNAATVLHKGDSAVLFMSGAGSYNGQPSYTGIRFHRFASASKPKEK